MMQREEQVFLLLSLLIGALTGLAVVAFILVTERLGMRIYPVGSAAWRRIAMPIAGSLAMGLGGFLAAKSDAEHYASEEARERREVQEIPGLRGV